MRIAIIFTILAVSLTTGAHAQQRQQVVTVFGGKQVRITTGASAEQKELGEAMMEFMYDYCYMADTTDAASAVRDRMILQIGSDVSKFSSFRMMQIDSLLGISTADQVRANPARYIGGETFSIYKNYPAGKFTFTDKISSDWFSFEEDVPVQEWILTEETKEIAGYPCRSAECEFRGRRYTAFYTEEIPVADGPWKFGGLPGFIMEVSDTEGHYSFVCVGINSKASRSITIPDVQYNKTNRGKYYKTKHKYDIDPIGYMASAGGTKVVITSPDGTPRTDMMQTRELQYDYIEKDWK